MAEVQADPKVQEVYLGTARAATTAAMSAVPIVPTVPDGRLASSPDGPDGRLASAPDGPDGRLARSSGVTVGTQKRGED